MEVEITPQLYELLLLQSAQSGFTVEELISFAFGNYIEKESDNHAE